MVKVPNFRLYLHRAEAKHTLLFRRVLNRGLCQPDPLASRGGWSGVGPERPHQRPAEECSYGFRERVPRRPNQRPDFQDGGVKQRRDGGEWRGKQNKLTNRQTNKQTARQTNRPNKQTNTQTHRHTHTHTHTQTDRQTHEQTQTNKHTYQQTQRQPENQKKPEQPSEK